MSGSLTDVVEALTNSDVPQAEARAALETLRVAFEEALATPSATARWAPSSLRGKQLCALPHVAKCLRAAGYVQEASAFQLPPSKADLPAIREGLDLVVCLLETMEVPAPDAMEVDGEEDPELAAALLMSVGAGGGESSPDAKRPRQETDAEVAARLAQEDDDHQQQVDVEFERFDGQNVLITDEAVQSINEYCAQTGEQYVDPQFPPVNRSLYINENDGVTWECFHCHTRTQLPPVPPMPTTEEEAKEVEASFEKVVCSGCGDKAPFVVKTRYFNRPTQWLRPGVRCSGCLATAPIEYPGMRDVDSILSIMCTHFLRSKATRKTLGQPWKVIRDQPRPEDVQQGALGNCWFVAALSIVASKPDLIWNLFITKEFNPHGAYQLQLFHAGDWRGILIDDLFPTSQVSPGKVVGEMIHYSRGGHLSYMNCGRHQLWVPLVEKAAAKLAGSYGNLSSGTFGEALAMFTGFPTERLILYVPKDERRRRAELRDERVAKRTEMLLRGEMPPEDDEEDLMLDESYRDDLLWSKMLSFQEAGYLMGMGCTEQGCEKTKEKILEMGLQAPHAYGILDVRECADEAGRIHRLVQIRNPWGEDAPRTWKGDWGKDSDKWTFDMKLKLGVVNRANVTMYDQMSIFWMSFADVKEYFAVVDVCRVHEGWEEYRERTWVPSGVGPGEAFELTVFERTQVDFALWQEKHITRASALGAQTNVDVGFVVLRKRGDNDDGSPEFECVDYAARSTDDCISQELILDGGYVYRIAPLCFNQMQAVAPRRVTGVVHSKSPLRLQKVPSSWRDVACAVLGAVALKGRPCMQSPGLRTMFLREACGYMLTVENDRDQPFGIQVDSTESIGYVSSREGGSCGCIDLVPPRSRKLVIALAMKRGAGRSALSFALDSLPPEAAAWAVGAEDVHMALPLTPLARQRGRAEPDPTILNAQPPERRKRPLAARGGHHTPKAGAAPPLLLPAADAEAQREAEEAEAALAEALRLSLGECGGEAGASPGGAGDDDDDLAEAIRMSMAAGALPTGSGSPPAAAPASASSAQPASSAPGGAADPSQVIKELFEEFRKQGMPPNEAAIRAVEEAKVRSARAPAPAAAAGAGSRDLQQLVKELFEEYRRQGLAPNDAAARAMQEAKARLSA